MLLSEWEEYLSSHFSDIARIRGQNNPLYGLEHGLTRDDIDLLKQSITEDLNQSKAISKYPVTWVVYASEIGYLFSGGEFWHTFETETPGWKQYGDRQWIKQSFLHFHDRYFGVQPSGPWALHFSIISWPIIHAILPNDLQRQLARVLYKLRDSLDVSVYKSPQEFGELIKAHSWDTTSRFQQLLQQPSIVGQVALALLQSEPQVDNELILPSTVERIRQDLDKESRAKFWLNSAQKKIHRRATLRGLHGDKRQAKGGADTIWQEPPARRLPIRPHLYLRANDGDLWRLGVEIPDYSDVLSWFPQCTESLTTSRIFIEGSSGKPIAPRGLLYGSCFRWLRNWPSTTKSMLRFEKSDETLDTLLEAESTLGEGPWLFKIFADGTAKQIVSRIVRPNFSYLILHQDEDRFSIPDARPAKVECNGICLITFDVHDKLSGDLISALETCGIQPSRQIRVSPVGVTPTQWDGEGSVEWLSTDDPVIAIDSSYPVKQYDFDLLCGDEVLNQFMVSDVKHTTTVFLQLPKLSVGVYYLDISVVSVEGHRVEKGRLDISIRNPIKIGDAINARGALQLNVYPPTPSLEELWEGKVSLEVIGPKFRRITCRFRLLEHNSRSVLYDHDKSITLPLTTNDWDKLLENHWQKNESCSYAYGASGICEILFDGGELGRQSLVCERSMYPLRWAFQHLSHGYQIRLVDDVEESVGCSVFKYSFDQPDIQHLMEVHLVRKPYLATETGLYVAVSGNQISAIIIPPEVTRFDQLRLTPRIQRQHKSVVPLLELIEYWAEARLVNKLAAGGFKNQVVEMLILEIFGKLGGSKWYRAEIMRKNQVAENWITEMAEIIPSKVFGATWAEVVLKQLPQLSVASNIERVDFLATLTGESLELCELVLRLASAPSTARHFAGDQFDHQLRELTRKTTVSRIARFLCLVIRDYLDTQSPPGASLYPSWRWN